MHSILGIAIFLHVFMLCGIPLFYVAGFFVGENRDKVYRVMKIYITCAIILLFGILIGVTFYG